MIDYNVAASRMALAGREMGSGPLVAVKRVLAACGIEDLVEKFGHERLESQRAVYQRFLNRADKGSLAAKKILETWKGPDAAAIARESGLHAYGVAVGLVMAENEAALKELLAIHDEWLKNGYAEPLPPAA